MIGIDRLLQKVVGAIFHGLDRFVDRAKGGHDNYGYIRVCSASAAQHIQTRSIWHPEVCEDQSMSTYCDLMQRLLGVSSFGYRITRVFQREIEYSTECFFIFNEKYVGHLKRSFILNLMSVKLDLRFQISDWRFRSKALSPEFKDQDLSIFILKSSI